MFPGFPVVLFFQLIIANGVSLSLLPFPSSLAVARIN
jgi:hypothetical protein